MRCFAKGNRTRALIAAASASLFAACAQPAAKSHGMATEEAIAKVTSNLRRAIVVEGRPDTAYALADRMAHYKVPGVSIAVADSGRIVWARGFGVKDVGTTDSVSATTLFQAASISKPVAATAMLRLVEEGKLDLDTPVNDYLKSWKVPDNRFTAKEPVTLRRIVSHNAGFTVHGFPGYAKGEAIPTVPQVLDGVAPANTAPVRVDTFPGAIWRYSGGGVTVEQLVLTDVTGERFPELMKRLVLDPAGMTHSTYEQPLPDSLHGQEAAAYRADGKMVVGRWHTYPEMAAAGLWTTPTDLLKWALAVAAARAGKSTALLSQEMATEMLTVQKAPSGLGPMLGGTGRGFHFGHGGANEGYRCELIYFPETGQGAAVMTNGDGGGTLDQEILLAIAAQYHWPDYGPRLLTPLPVDSTALARYVGEYVSTRPPVTIVVAQEGSRLYAAVAGESGRSEIVLTSPEEATGVSNGVTLRFATGAHGRIDRIMVQGITLTKK
jgi:CubicO group peptidase (beta-lactamase class C family)